MALALIAAVAVGGCEQEAAEQQVAVAPTKPTSAADAEGWQQYLSYLVKNNMQGMTASRPYVYYVPAGDDPTSQSQYFNQLDNVRTTVARTVLAGNLMAFGGPSSAKTANLIVDAFKGASPGSFEGVIVLFMGDEADRARVEQALAPSGATYRFVAM